MVQARRFLWKWKAVELAIFLTVVSLTAITIGYASLKNTQDLARFGNAARQRQAQVFPSTCKDYADKYQRGVWDVDDLLRVMRNAPGMCAPVARILTAHGVAVPPPLKLKIKP